MARAATVTVDGLIYSISGTTASVTSQGGNKDLIEVIIPETIEVDGTTYEVITISSKAFTKCPSLTSITIPGTVTNLGEYAFSECSKLESINIPASVSKVGNYAFYRCSSLKNLTIEDSDEVLSLGINGDYNLGLFSHCSLENLYLGRNLDYNPKYNSSNPYIRSPFRDLKNLSSIVIGKNVTILGYSLFSGCERISSLTIPPKVTEIKDYAFAGCTGIISIIIEDSDQKLTLGINSYTANTFSSSPLTTVYLGRDISYKTVTPGSASYPSVTNGHSPFYGKKELESLTIGDKVTTIGKYAFSGCSGIKELTIPNSVTTISAEAFKGIGISTIVIPNSVTIIEDNAFSSCNELGSITFVDAESKSIEAIKCSSSAFANDQNITEYYLGRNVSSHGLPNNVLSSITIGANVTSLPYFTSQEKLSKIYCKAVTPPATGDFHVDTYQFGELFVPCESTKKYSKAAIWRNFYSITGFNPESFEIDGLRYVLDQESKTAKATYQQQHNMDNYSDLIDVTIPETVMYNGVTYTVVGIGAEAFNYCWGLKSITLPKTITSIDNAAFGYCTSLRTIEIPNSVKAIGDEAFTGCSALSSAKIGESVESIGDYGFFGCTGLSEITVPESVNHIGEYAFMGVHWLNEVHAESIVPSDAHVTSFSNMAYENATLYVPAGTLDTYKAHPTWSKFLKVKIEGDTSGIDEIESDNETIVTVSGSTITITGKGESDQVTVYDLTGRQLLSTTDSRFTVDQASGIVVVYVNRKAHKVTLR